MKILCKYEADYSDEFDVYGYSIRTKAELEKEKTKLLKIIEEEGKICYCFGTNEEIIYESYDDIMNDYTFIKIDDSDATVYKDTLGMNFGHTGPLFY